MMEKAMKKTGVKKLVSVLAALTIALGTTASLATNASALTQSFNRDLTNGRIDDTFDWCNPQYEPNNAKAKVRIWMDKTMIAKSKIQIYGKVNNRVTCLLTEEPNHSTSSGGGTYTDSGWKEPKVAVKAASSLTLCGKRFYNNGTTMEYNTNYYNNQNT